VGTMISVLRSSRIAPFAASLLAVASLTGSARATEPWSDPDPPAPPERHALTRDIGVRGAAEYRAQLTYVNPISLNTGTDRRVNFIDHRLRLDAGVDFRDRIRIVTSIDALDGVLWGDNGTLGTNPEPNAGSNVTAKNPNIARPCVTQLRGDALDRNAYGYGLCSAPPLMVRRLYADVVLPFGLLRVGRQAVSAGTGVQTTDGDGRANRFGVSHAGNSVDRILFATKPLEGFKPKAERNLSENEGFFLGIAYDRWVQDRVGLQADDLQQSNVGFRWLTPKAAFWRDVVVSGYWAHRWDGQYETAVNSFGLRAYARVGDFTVGFDAATNLGSTREISEAFKVVTNDQPVDQAVRQLGARAVVRYDQPLWSAYLEGDYASGDGDPLARTPLTQFLFAPDTNVGLLLFEHVLAFQTARAAAAAIESLRRLGATSYPVDSIATNGSFTNAFAIFPQVDVRPVPDLLLRGGVLMAWAPAPVVDPATSLLARDGLTIEDDLVNFAGGKPATYYGTELDGRIQYRFMDHFAADLEGAILFPGAALQNRDGDAVRSVLVQGRTTFFF
jgi:hypothetical protein